MYKQYTVYLTHKLRAVETVFAQDESEAREKAYKHSWENKDDWEEMDYKVDKVTVGDKEYPEDDEILIGEIDDE